MLNASYCYSILHENGLEGGDMMVKMGKREGVRVAKSTVIRAKIQ
jgi:hypothetical protein